MSYVFQPAPASTPSLLINKDQDVVFYSAGEEMLRITRGNFYVRGIAVEADDVTAVYDSFKQWLVYQNLTR